MRFSSNCAIGCDFEVNRPFYGYGGRIELIRFKEHEHISFVFSSAFQDIFSYSFLRIRL